MLRWANKNGYIQKTKKTVYSKYYVLLFCVFRAVLKICLSLDYFIMVPLNFTDLHCLEHFFFEHLFNFYNVKM